MSSWADIAAKNTPEQLEAHPDTSLLEKKEDHPSHSGESAVDYEAEHVHGESNILSLFLSHVFPYYRESFSRKGDKKERSS